MHRRGTWPWAPNSADDHEQPTRNPPRSRPRTRFSAPAWGATPSGGVSRPADKAGSAAGTTSSSGGAVVERGGAAATTVRPGAGGGGPRPRASPTSPAAANPRAVRRAGAHAHDPRGRAAGARARSADRRRRRSDRRRHRRRRHDGDQTGDDTGTALPSESDGGDGGSTLGFLPHHRPRARAAGRLRHGAAADRRRAAAQRPHAPAQGRCARRLSARPRSRPGRARARRTRRSPRSGRASARSARRDSIPRTPMRRLSVR